jgi:hypothetical protein
MAAARQKLINERATVVATTTLGDMPAREAEFTDPWFSAIEDIFRKTLSLLPFYDH